MTDRAIHLAQASLGRQAHRARYEFTKYQFQLALYSQFFFFFLFYSVPTSNLISVSLHPRCLLRNCYA